MARHNTHPPLYSDASLALAARRTLSGAGYGLGGVCMGRYFLRVLEFWSPEVGPRAVPGWATIVPT